MGIILNEKGDVIGVEIGVLGEVIGLCVMWICLAPLGWAGFSSLG